MQNYEEFKDDLILRDHLATDRTILANERTLLAYMRTFIGILVSGAGLIRFTDDRSLIIIGIILSSISPIILAFGIWRFLKVRSDIKKIR